MSKRILHVEDDQDWSSTIRGLLEDEGYIVTSVASVKEARPHLGQVDIIICDGNLINDFDAQGFAFAKELHDQGRKVLVFAARRRDPQIPFVSKYESHLLLGAIAQL